jgi:hypothetical protein
MTTHCERLTHTAVNSSSRPKRKDRIRGILILVTTKVKNAIKTRHIRQKQQKELYHSNDRYLKELGLSRFDIGKGSRSYFWNVRYK